MNIYVYHLQEIEFLNSNYDDGNYTTKFSNTGGELSNKLVCILLLITLIIYLQYR